MARAGRPFLQLFEQAKEHPAHQAADGAAERAVAQFAERAGRNALGQADGQSEEHPTEAARQHFSHAAQRGSGQESLNQVIIHLLSQPHAERPT